jgi:hypothetical protein
MRFGKKDVNHRRMDDPSKSFGTSFGGGQKVNTFASFNNFIVADLIGFRFLGCCFKWRSTPQYLQAFSATVTSFALQALPLVGVVITQYITAGSHLVCRLFRHMGARSICILCAAHAATLC